MTKEKTVVPFALIAAAGAVLLFGTLTSGHDWGGDFATYISQAISLVDTAPRSFIAVNRAAMEQSSYAVGPVVYPWGFPVMLAPFYAMFGLDMLALKIVGVLSYLLFIVLLWFGFRSVHSGTWFLCLVGLFALNPTLIAFTDHILSDLPFLFFSTFAVVLIGRVIVEKRPLISRSLDLVLIGAVIAAAFFVRTNGALLLVTLAFSQTVSHLQNRSSDPVPLRLHVVPYVVFASLVLAWGLVLPEGGESYLVQLRAISTETIKTNLHYYLDQPAEFFSGVPHHPVVYGASIPLVAAGMIRRHRLDYPAILYIALTFLLYVAWPPQRQGIRFLFPILPFCASFGLSGLEMFQGGATSVEKWARRFVCYVPVLLIVLYFGEAASADAYHNLKGNREPGVGPFMATSRSMFSFIADQTEGTSTVIFFKPTVMRLMTGRKSVMIKRPEQVSRGDYLCYYRGSGAYDQISPAALQERLDRGVARLVYENSDFSVYALRQTPPGR